MTLGCYVTTSEARPKVLYAVLHRLRILAVHMIIVDPRPSHITGWAVRGARASADYSSPESLTILFATCASGSCWLLDDGISLRRQPAYSKARALQLA